MYRQAETDSENETDDRFPVAYSNQTQLVPKSVTSVTFSPSTTTIKNAEFRACRNLRAINALVCETHLTSIGKHAFRDCYSLTSVRLPDSTTFIDRNAFTNCGNLREIRIPASLEVLSKETFLHCHGLETLHLPQHSASLTTIEQAAFRQCTSLSSITNLSSQSNLASIGIEAFFECRLLTQPIFPPSLQHIDDRAFFGCEALSGTLRLPPSVQSVGSLAFACCVNLELVEIPNPDNLESIAADAFDGCVGLKAIVLGGYYGSITTAVEVTNEDEEGGATNHTNIHDPDHEDQQQQQHEEDDDELHTQQLPMNDLLDRALTQNPTFHHINLQTLLDNGDWIDPYHSETNNQGSRYYNWTKCARTPDSRGRFPLALVAERKIKWCSTSWSPSHWPSSANEDEDETGGGWVGSRRYRGGGWLEEVAVADLSVVEKIDGWTGMMCFMLAAVGEESDLETVYRLLVEFPPAIGYF